MQLNIPSQIRQIIYVLVVIGTSIIVPLNATGVLNDVILLVWSSVSGAASLLAGFNVSHN